MSDRTLVKSFHSMDFTSWSILAIASFLANFATIAQ
jgi:hypothetical protein